MLAQVFKRNPLITSRLLKKTKLAQIM